MRISYLISGLFLTLATSIVIHAQSSTQPTTQSPRATTAYFVDEVGLKIAAQLPFEGMVDPDVYIVGSFDVFTVEVKGAVPATWRGLTVNAQGHLVIPTVGSVDVGGIVLRTAMDRIRNTVSDQFRAAEVLVNLEVPKQVNVHVTGDVVSPGRYIFPPHTRADIAILPAIFGARASQKSTSDKDEDEKEEEEEEESTSTGGIQPTAKALDLYSNSSGAIPSDYNLRHVQITHRDGRQSVVDLLAYYYGGMLGQNPFVSDGDVISVYRKSTTMPRISISGAVRIALEFEYREDDTLEKLFAIAGGFSTNADTTDIRIYRRVGNQTRLIQVSSTSDELLFPNDRILVGSRQDEIGQNVSAWVSGEVSTPGNFPILEGTTSVYDILQMAEGVTPEALAAGAYLERTNISIQNQILKENEQLWFRRSSDQLEEGFRYLSEESNFSGRFMFIDLSNEARSKELLLMDGDRLFVPKNNNTVFVFGQVNLAGYYMHQVGSTAASYVLNAGGMALAAQPDRVFIIKAGSRTWHKADDVSIEPGDMVFVDRVPFDDLQSRRQFQMLEMQQRNNNYALIYSTVSTIASIITTAILITR